MKHLRWITLFIALLWCGNAYALDGTSLDWVCNLPPSGASMWTADNATLEQKTGTSYFACGAVIQRSDLSTAGNQTFIGKFATTGDQRTFILYLGNPNATANFLVSKDGTLTNYNQSLSSIGSLNNKAIHFAVGQFYAAESGVSSITDVKFWLDGNMFLEGAPAIRKANSMYDSTTPVAIGAGGVENNLNFNGKIYQAWMAFADVPIIAADQKVTDWARSKTVLPFEPAGVSRYFLWNGSGLTGNRWMESGVSLGKTSGQFDLLPSRNPQIILPE